MIPLVLRLVVAGLGLAVSCAVASPAAGSPTSIGVELASLDQPSAVYFTGAAGGRGYGSASGMADPAASRKLTVDTPVRIASNTKTFVAATVLRLWEQGRVDLDAPIGPLVSPGLDRLLRRDGYQTNRITVRHLLSHSSGLYDHGSDPRFTKALFADPQHHWTREELIGLMVEYADPQSEPGTEFRYSDDGYILLGDIVERITGKSVAAAVREQLRLNRLGLRSTWWEVMETAPQGATERARQWLGSQEATNIHASMDLYGGGGLVMSARDLAIFMQALFGGKIFDRASTLSEMLWQGPHRGADQYRLGIFVKRTADGELYWHSGFWGTIAYYDPKSHMAVAGLTTNQDGFKNLVRVVEGALSTSNRPR